ncbi:hypothetical protein BCR33DRAFT_832174 [Rhizoclosmatium globosum]|uniref:GDSL lipase/acylhydrolase n=1 Tax=Rhizoclosmatium globosum TaxID=329046 RepID=A0A1Y2BV58_9FUNG|nr:hypothetical protein BCR33DRAFT_832174 [Rhizoclosmatium globosum]|eukprot:ORY38668.1 hypothetical protein BCR33DRAFT_832174 [Rhizoclosmatium globosum]
MKSILSLILLSSTAFAALSPSTVIKDVVAFGDSLSDNGNFFKYEGTPPAPYWQGRFSNGPVWVEQLAKTLNNANLHNYAVAGAVANVTDAYHHPIWFSKSLTANDLPDLSKQIANWKADSSANALNLDTTLFTIWAGANDLTFTVDSGNIPDPVAYATYILTGVQILIQSGAKNILVNGFAPLERLPMNNKLASTATSQIKQVVDGFNAVLSAGISNLQGVAPKANIIFNDVTPLLYYTVTPEGSAYYGFKNVEDACNTITANATILSTCANPDDYFFWDVVHPTTKAHKLIAAGAYNTLFNISGFPTVLKATASAIITSSLPLTTTATQGLIQSGTKEIRMCLFMAAVGILMF